MPMRVTANGHEYDIADGTTVAAFIRQRSLDPRSVVVERNGEAVERARYDDLRLEPGDRLELVRAVAGGSGEGETVLSEPAAPASLGEWRRRRLAAARLYVVTDARQGQGDLAEFLEEILDAGVDVVQLREKDAEAGDLLRWAEVFREAAERHQALFFVNDRPDVALACGADGVHVGQNDLPPAFVRGLVGERRPDRAVDARSRTVRGRGPGGGPPVRGAGARDADQARAPGRRAGAHLVRRGAGGGGRRVAAVVRDRRHRSRGRSPRSWRRARGGSWSSGR